MAQAGDDTITLATGADLTGNLTGGDGEDSLVGGSGADTFTLTGTDSGTMDKLTTGNTWAEIENLSGGDGDNTFAVETGGEISGSLTGGVGTSTMDYSARSDSLSVTFTGSSAEGFAAESAQGGSATGIDALTAGSARDDTCHLTTGRRLKRQHCGRSGSRYLYPLRQCQSKGQPHCWRRRRDKVSLRNDATVDGDISTGAGDDTDTLDVSNLLASSTAGVIDYRNFETINGIPNARVQQQGAAPVTPTTPTTPTGTGTGTGTGRPTAPPTTQPPTTSTTPTTQPPTTTTDPAPAPTPEPAPAPAPTTPVVTVPTAQVINPANPTRLVITLPPAPGADPTAPSTLVIVDRAAESAQSTAIVVLSSAVHNVVTQRLSGGGGLAPRVQHGAGSAKTGGGSSNRRGQMCPLQVAAGQARPLAEWVGPARLTRC